jgi:Na+/melibiose symporter-like transporter
MNTPLTMKRTLLYSSASAGLNIMAISVSTWMLYFYSPPPDSGRPVYLPITMVGLLMTITSLWDVMILLLVTSMSPARWGRRHTHVHTQSQPSCSCSSSPPSGPHLP